MNPGRRRALLIGLVLLAGLALLVAIRSAGPPSRQAETVEVAEPVEATSSTISLRRLRASVSGVIGASCGWWRQSDSNVQNSIQNVHSPPSVRPV